VPIIYAQYLYRYWYLKVMYWYLYWYLDHWYWYWYLFVEYLIQDCIIVHVHYGDFAIPFLDNNLSIITLQYYFIEKAVRMQLNKN